MRTHPYLRAYMAGIVVPTLLLLIAPLTFVLSARFVDAAPGTRLFIQVAVFPGAIVPNLWGVWNLLYLRFRPSMPLPVFGALLPLLLVPMIWYMGPPIFPPAPWLLLIVPIGMAIYYLVWKFVVGFLNQEMGIA